MNAAIANAWTALSCSETTADQLGALHLLAVGMERLCDAEQIIGTPHETTIRQCLCLLDSFAYFDLLTATDDESQMLRRAAKRAVGLVGRHRGETR